MIRSLAIAVVVAPSLILVGCGTPSELEKPELNHYPRIVEGLVKPANQVVGLELGTNCMRLQFSAVVEDPDLDDPIRSRWFVDPDPTFGGVSYTSPTISGSRTSIRKDPIGAPEQLFAIGGKLAEAGQHRLVLVIADGEFGVGIETSPLVFNDAGAKDPTYTDTYTWFVTTSRDPCPQ